MSRQARPFSIISTMLRRWPCARFSRLTISGCVVCSIGNSNPPGRDLSSAAPQSAGAPPPRARLLTGACLRRDVAFVWTAAMAEERVERRLTAILAADVAGYSRLMGADEEGTLAALKTLRREVADPKIKE